MEYVSERITNIGDLESIIRDARVKAALLLLEIEKDSPPMHKISAISKEIARLLEDAEHFEFQIDRRKVAER